jgi:hypothetical protein
MREHVFCERLLGQLTHDSKQRIKRFVPSLQYCLNGLHCFDRRFESVEMTIGSLVFFSFLDLNIKLGSNFKVNFVSEITT